MENRNKILYRKKLCYEFLVEIFKEHKIETVVPIEHCAKSAFSRFHLIVLHSLIIEKHKKNRNNEDADTKKRNRKK